MSWLLFMDESGHDRKSAPYEVRGGVALSAGRLWPFVQSVQRLELEAFGCLLSEFKKEFKGSHLLDKNRFAWAAQGPAIPDPQRRKLAKSFLEKGVRKDAPTKPEFTAYGQACISMALGVFQALRDHDACLFAVAIPRTTQKPPGPELEYLRKDQVFLLERYFYFLEQRQEHGLLVLDQVEDSDDLRLVSRLQRYFQRTDPGRYRSKWIVPTPLFVSSDLVTPIQAADVCIYCVNWGFRLPTQGMNEPTREEIAGRFGSWIRTLQFRGEGYRDGNVFQSYGVAFVSEPYGPRA